MFIMLPRSAPWYEAMLGTIRIGAVVSPGTNQLTSRDIAYRINKAAASVAITGSDGAAKIDAITEPIPSLTRKFVSGGDPGNDWLNWEQLLKAPTDTGLPDDPTAADDPMILFFTSGTVSHAKMVRQNQSYGLGHISTARFWHDLRPGDRPLDRDRHGWAKARLGRAVRADARARHDRPGRARQA